jgi:hypothetical protein
MQQLCSVAPDSGHIHIVHIKHAINVAALVKRHFNIQTVAPIIAPNTSHMITCRNACVSDTRRLSLGRRHSETHEHIMPHHNADVIENVATGTAMMSMSVGHHHEPFTDSVPFMLHSIVK